MNLTPLAPLRPGVNDWAGGNDVGLGDDEEAITRIVHIGTVARCVFSLHKYRLAVF